MGLDPRIAQAQDVVTVWTVWVEAGGRIPDLRERRERRRLLRALAFPIPQFNWENSPDYGAHSSLFKAGALLP